MKAAMNKPWMGVSDSKIIANVEFDQQGSKLTKLLKACRELSNCLRPHELYATFLTSAQASALLKIIKIQRIYNYSRIDFTKTELVLFSADNTSQKPCQSETEYLTD